MRNSSDIAVAMPGHTHVLTAAATNLNQTHLDQMQLSTRPAISPLRKSVGSAGLDLGQSSRWNRPLTSRRLLPRGARRSLGQPIREPVLVLVVVVVVCGNPLGALQSAYGDHLCSDAA